MSEYIIKLGILTAAVINLLPLIGVLSRLRLERLYGVKVANANLEVLMRHRAVLFGIVGGLLLASVFIPAWQNPAIAAGLVSMLSFIALTVVVNGYVGAFRHIVYVDLLGIAALIAAIVLIARRA